MKANGKVFKYGDNVDTDVIIPARYLAATSEKELAAHCMEDIDPEFIRKVQPGDIIVAEKWQSRAPEFPVSSQRPSHVFFTETPLISDFRLLNARRRPMTLRTEIWWRWILTAEKYMTAPGGRNIRGSHFRRLCRRSSETAD